MEEASTHWIPIHKYYNNKKNYAYLFDVKLYY